MNVKNFGVLAAMIGAMLVGMLAGGCDAAGGGNPVGVWTVDKAKSKAAFAAWMNAATEMPMPDGTKKAVTDSDRKEAIAGHAAAMDGPAGGLVVTLNADKTCSASGGGAPPATGTWSLDEKTGTLTVTPKDAPEDKIEAKLSGGQLTLYQGTIPGMVMVKTGAAPAAPAR